MPQTNNKGGTFHGIWRVWFGITQGDLHIPIPKGLQDRASFTKF